MTILGDIYVDDQGDTCEPVALLWPSLFNDHRSKHIRSWNRRAVIHTVRSVLVNRDAALDTLHNVTARALVVSGKEDTILPYDHSRRIVAQLPNAHHVEVAGAAHLVPLEQPDTANALMLAFLKDSPRL